MMTTEHPRWEEFVRRLEGPEGCDFKQDNTWKCAGGRDKSFAISILENMGCSPTDLAAQVDYFESRGGYCDCEIIFNIAC